MSSMTVSPSPEKLNKEVPTGYYHDDEENYSCLSPHDHRDKIETDDHCHRNFNPTVVIHPGEVTPTKVSCEDTNPVTPTANLKLLADALSPEFRQRDMLLEKAKALKSLDNLNDAEDHKKKIEYLSSFPKMQSFYEEDEETPKTNTGIGSRKEKSLGLLCQRFIALYNEYPTSEDDCHISLDIVSKQLNVERRRIYDIINVLESLHIVSRVAKNCYTWHGKTALHSTLAKLKKLGLQQGMREGLCHAFKIENEVLRGELPTSEYTHNSVTELMKQDKSLGIMSQRFLMLFLVSDEKTFQLEFAAKVLLGDHTFNKTDCGKIKTKIRRLYDIANILTSLKLIKKVTKQDGPGKKPAFFYCGPYIDELADCEDDVTMTPNPKHSLLPSTNVFPKTTGLQRTRSFNLPPATKKNSLVRHSSFDQICVVASEERKKMYFDYVQPLATAGDIEKSPRSSHISVIKKGSSIHMTNQSCSSDITPEYRSQSVIKLLPSNSSWGLKRPFNGEEKRESCKKFCGVRCVPLSSPVSTYSSHESHKIIPTITHISPMNSTSSSIYHLQKYNTPIVYRKTPENSNKDINGNCVNGTLPTITPIPYNIIPSVKAPTSLVVNKGGMPQISQSKAILNLGTQLRKLDEKSENSSVVSSSTVSNKLVKTLSPDVKLLCAQDLKRLTPNNQVITSEKILKEIITPGGFFRGTPSSAEDSVQLMPNGNNIARKLSLQKE